MKRILFFELIICLIGFFNSADGQSCPCRMNSDVLQCNITNILSTVNADSCDSNSYNSINIFYEGDVNLNLIASTIKPISVKPLDGGAYDTLRISNINTNAVRIDIQINLSSAQVSTALLTTSGLIRAPNSILSIRVIQTIADANSFKVFNNPSTAQVNVANYEIVFDTSSASSGSLNLPYLISGLQNPTSITISGNNHTLLVDPAQMSSPINVTQLSLKKLRLYDRILVNILNLNKYSIEECYFNRTSQFLISTHRYDLSVEMKNNYPENSVLPFVPDTFTQLLNLTSLTLIEPRLSSSSLKAIKTISYPSKVLIRLDQYNQTEMGYWGDNRPTIWQLTIENIPNLNIFPSLFFNKFYAITKLTLKGTFELKKADICIFVGINRQSYAASPIVNLDSSGISANDWYNCAKTYITAINQRTMNDIECPPENKRENCPRWANATEECNLVTYENACPGTIDNSGFNFRYNNSELYNFFKQSFWLNATTYPSRPSSKEDRINIGAIIGAVCGLLVAAVILGLTVFCIYRHRQNNATKYITSTPGEKYVPSSHDATHVSIATSKSSKSSRYALEKSFFPPIQPNDEIAPPLYTAPSESVGSVSAYNLPSAPPAPRDSVSTHVYETVYS